MGAHGEVPYPSSEDARLGQEFNLFDPKYVTSLFDAENIVRGERMLKGFSYDVKIWSFIGDCSDAGKGFTPFSPQLGMRLTQNGLTDGEGVLESVSLGVDSITGESITVERFPEAPYALFVSVHTPGYKKVESTLLEEGFFDLHLQIFFPGNMGTFESSRAPKNQVKNSYDRNFYPVETGPIGATECEGLPILLPADLEKLLQIKARFVKHASFPSSQSFQR